MIPEYYSEKKNKLELKTNLLEKKKKIYFSLKPFH